MRRVVLAVAVTVPLSGCGWLSNGFGSVSEFFGYGTGGEGCPTGRRSRSRTIRGT